MFGKGNKWVKMLSLILVVGLSGCASLKEDLKGFLGVSTKVLEEGRQSAIVKSYAFGYADCFEKVRSVLLDKGSYIYAGDRQKKMLAIYVSTDDTTPVGIYFQEEGPQGTRIEVSSPSTYAKEKISRRIEIRILGLDDPEKEPKEGEEQPVPGNQTKTKIFQQD